MAKNDRQMLNEIAEHYGVKQESKSYTEFVTAVKAAANGKFDSIGVIYERLKKPTTPKTIDVKPNAGVSNSTSVAHPVVDGRLPAVVPQQATRVEGVASVRRATDVVEIHMHPPTITTPPPVREHRAFLPAFGSWCQTMALGVVVGVLVSRHVLKFAGFQ